MRLRAETSTLSWTNAWAHRGGDAIAAQDWGTGAARSLSRLGQTERTGQLAGTAIFRPMGTPQIA